MVVRMMTVVVAVGLVVGGSLASGQEPSREAQRQALARALEGKSTDDLFKVPENASVDELMKFIEDLLQFQPSSRAEAEAFQTKGFAAMKTAAEKIQKLEKDKTSEAWRTAQNILLQLRMRDLNDKDAAVNKRQLLADVVAFVKGSDLGVQELSLARSLCTSLEYSDNHELAGEAYATFGEMFKKSDNKRVADLAEKLIGASRRMRLVGQPLELKGTTLDGHPFNIKDLKGKVVLVDFWATWCGPCRREFPNIEKNYSDYKDKGFEVVGVSLDQDREALEEYVKEQKVPWITLHEKDKDGDHPAADYYGIIGIPSMMLVGKDGNVVTLSARGEQLGQELEKLLGPPPTDGDDKDSDKK